MGMLQLSFSIVLLITVGLITLTVLDSADDINATPCIGGYYPMGIITSKWIIPTSLGMLLVGLLYIANRVLTKEPPTEVS